MVLGKQQLMLGGVLIVVVIAAICVFTRGEKKPEGSTARTSEIERAIRADLAEKQVCGFCMEPDAAQHKVGDITLKDLGSDIFKASIEVTCMAAPDGKPRVKVLTREYAFVGGETICTMPNLGWKSPEAK